jgi:hypothetical protein
MPTNTATAPAATAAPHEHQVSLLPGPVGYLLWRDPLVDEEPVGTVVSLVLRDATFTAILELYRLGQATNRMTRHAWITGYAYWPDESFSAQVARWRATRTDPEDHALPHKVLYRDGRIVDALGRPYQSASYVLALPGKEILAWNPVWSVP